MSKAKKFNFPKILYAYRDFDGDEVYYIASETLDGIENDAVVGIYEFKEEGKMVVKRELER